MMKMGFIFVLIGSVHASRVLDIMFILVSGILSRMVMMATIDSRLIGIKIKRSCLPLHKLFFINDSIFLFQFNLIEYAKLNQIVVSYYCALRKAIMRQNRASYSLETQGNKQDKKWRRL